MKLHAPRWAAIVRQDEEEVRMAMTVCAVIQLADGEIWDWAAYTRKVEDTRTPVEIYDAFPAKLPYEVATVLFPTLPKEKYRS